MDNRRIKLQKLLEQLLGSDDVYYQPPETKKMNYPAIRYKLEGIRDEYANDHRYGSRRYYDLTVISRTPDHPVINKILELPYTSYVSHYASDGLNHDKIRIYY